MARHKRTHAEFSGSGVAGGWRVVMAGERAQGVKPPGRWVLCITIRGTVVMKAGADTLTVTQGDLVLIEPGVLNQWVVPEQGKKKNTWEVIYVVFTPRPHWLAWMRYPAALPGHLHVSVRGPAHWARIVEAMKDVYTHATSALPQSSDLAMNAIEAALLWCSINQANRPPSLDPRVADAVAYLSTHLRDPLTLAELAQKCHTSRARLASIFRTQVGMPPMKYLEQRRVALACELLRMTNESVQQVALAAGFEDANYFAKRFRRAVGQSPRAFRQQAFDQR